MATAGLDGLVITGTRFDELSIAVLDFAALGGLRIEDNSVHGCYAGFWLIALDMPAYFDLTGSYDVQNVDRGTMTAINSSVTNLALDPVFLMLYAVGRTYPLPAGYQPPAATPGTTVTATQWTAATGSSAPSRPGSPTPAWPGRRARRPWRRADGQGAHGGGARDGDGARPTSRGVGA
jgi:hypothetical protein